MHSGGIAGSGRPLVNCLMLPPGIRRIVLVRTVRSLGFRLRSSRPCPPLIKIPSAGWAKLTYIKEHAHHIGFSRRRPRRWRLQPVLKEARKALTLQAFQRPPKLADCRRLTCKTSPAKRFPVSRQIYTARRTLP